MQLFRYTLYVNDIDVSVRFYEQVVGFPVIRRFTKPGMDLAFLGDEETRVELIQGKVGTMLLRQRFGRLSSRKISKRRSHPCSRTGFPCTAGRPRRIRARATSAWPTRTVCSYSSWNRRRSNPSRAIPVLKGAHELILSFHFR